MPSTGIGGGQAPIINGLGLNSSPEHYFQGPWYSVDLLADAQVMDTTRMSTTLSAAHVAADGVLNVVNGDVFENTDDIPGTLSASGSFVIKDSTSGNVFQGKYWHVCGTNWLGIISITSGTDVNCASGSQIDNLSNWANPTVAAIASNFVDTGRDTGWPNGLATTGGAGQKISSAVAQNENIQAGVYTLVCKGSGTVTGTATYTDGSSDAYSATFSSGTVTSGSASWTIATGKEVSNLALSVTASTAGNPIRDWHLIRPDRVGFADNYLSLFTAGLASNPAFYMHTNNVINDVKLFNGFRNMDRYRTNLILHKSWSDRSPVNPRIGFDFHNGAPPERMTQFQFDSAMDYHWYNMSAFGSDAYITSFADLIRDTTGANSYVCIQYSNEVWNTAFVAPHYHSQMQGASLYGPWYCSGATYSGGVVTVTKTAHGFTAGQQVIVANASQAAYNGVFNISSVPTANTFTYSIGSSPSSPAVPVEFTQIQAAPYANAKVCSDVTWTTSSSNSLFAITCPSHGVGSGDWFFLANISQANWNGMYRAQKIIDSNTIQGWFSDAPKSALPPLPTSGVLSATAVAGTSIVIVPVVKNSGVSPTSTDVGFEWDGMRSAQIALIFMTEFAGHLDRLNFMVGVQTSASSTQNAKLVTQYLTTLTGSPTGPFPAGPRFNLAVAPYYYPNADNSLGRTGVEQYKQVPKIPTGITFSGTTATVALAAHGQLVGDTVLVRNCTDSKYDGIFTVASVVTNVSFTYTMENTPAANAAAVSGTVITYDDWQALSGAGQAGPMSNIASIVWDGSALATVTTRAAHPFGTNDSVHIFNVLTPEFNGVWQVTSTGSTTFTFPMAFSSATTGTFSTGLAASAVRDPSFISGTKTITSLSNSGTTATATITAHGLTTGQDCQVCNAVDPNYCGIFTITAATANTITYTMPGTPSLGNGAITATTLTLAMNQPYQREITALSASTGTATATSYGHKFQVGDVINVTGANVANYNVRNAIVTGRTTSTFSYTISGSPVAATIPTSNLRPWAYKALAYSQLLGATDQYISSTGKINSVLAAQLALAQTYTGMGMVAYEFGQSIVCTPTNKANVFLLDMFQTYNHDPYIQTQYSSVISRIKANGVTMAYHYNYISPDAPAGYWGAKADQNFTGSQAPKWSALLASITPLFWRQGYTNGTYTFYSMTNG